MTTVFRWIQLLTSTWLILIVVQSLSLDKRHFKYLVYLGFFATNVAVMVFAVITLKQMYRTSFRHRSKFFNLFLFNSNHPLSRIIQCLLEYCTRFNALALPKPGMFVLRHLLRQQPVITKF
jgi:hypothetical protein